MYYCQDLGLWFVPCSFVSSMRRVAVFFDTFVDVRIVVLLGTTAVRCVCPGGVQANTLVMLVSCHFGTLVDKVSPCMLAISSLRTLFTIRCCATSPLPANWGDSTWILYMDPHPPAGITTETQQQQSSDKLLPLQGAWPCPLPIFSIYLRYLEHQLWLLRARS